MELPAPVCPALWASWRRSLNGVYSANEYLTRGVNLMKAYMRIPARPS